jgi:hypothetical protein
MCATGSDSLMGLCVRTAVASCTRTSAERRICGPVLELVQVERVFEDGLDVCHADLLVIGRDRRQYLLQARFGLLMSLRVRHSTQNQRPGC